jgi:hypothetical protein
VRAAFCRLHRREPDRADFTQKEICDYIEAYWEVICWNEVRCGSWRSMVRSTLASGRLADGSLLFAPRRRLPANSWTLSAWQGPAGEARSRRVRGKDIAAVAVAPLWAGPDPSPAKPRRRSRVGSAPQKRSDGAGAAAEPRQKSAAEAKAELYLQRQRTLAAACMSPVTKRRRISAGNVVGGEGSRARRDTATSPGGPTSECQPERSSTGDPTVPNNESDQWDRGRDECNFEDGALAQRQPFTAAVSIDGARTANRLRPACTPTPGVFSYNAIPLCCASLGTETLKRYASAMKIFEASKENETFQSQVASCGDEMVPVLLDEAVASYFNSMHGKTPGPDGWMVCNNLLKALLHRNLRWDVSTFKMASASLGAWRSMLPGDDVSTVETQ